MILLALACGEPVETGRLADSAQPEDASPYETAASCGECHPTHYAEWRQSMHAYAAKSPVFDAMTGKAYRDSAGEIGTFCTGCHTPFGTEDGEPGFTTAASRSALSLEGVSCDYCHTAVGNSGLVGNTSIITDPGMVKYGPIEGASGDAHGSQHSDFVTSPELCGSCHDVFKFPGLQIEEAYTEFTTSPASEEGLRCQDCHMSTTPGVPAERPQEPIAIVPGESYPARPRSTHRFIGPDYALIDDFPYPDDLEASATAQADQLLLIEQLLKSSVAIQGLDVTRVGSSLDLTVTVESLTPGHSVPTGFTSERQLWLAVNVYAGDGSLVFASGDLDENLDLRDIHSSAVQQGTVTLDEQLSNFQSKNITLSAAYSQEGQYLGGILESSESMFPFEANYIDKHSLAPLEVRDLGYSIVCAPDCARIEVALNYRNLPPYVLRALGVSELVPRLHLFTLDTAELEL